jgi:hypothetical protein
MMVYFQVLHLYFIKFILFMQYNISILYHQLTSYYLIKKKKLIDVCFKGYTSIHRVSIYHGKFIVRSTYRDVNSSCVHPPHIYIFKSTNNTFTKPFPEVFHCLSSHFWCNGCHFLSDCLLKCFQKCWAMSVDLDL